jgi:RecA/RadA recombinase
VLGVEDVEMARKLKVVDKKVAPPRSQEEIKVLRQGRKARPVLLPAPASLLA